MITKIWGSIKLWYRELSEARSPKQRDRILRNFNWHDDSKNDNHELTLLLNAYKSPVSYKQKIMILSAIDLKIYTKEKVMDIFDCPRYKVDAAWNGIEFWGHCMNKKR